MKKLFLALFAVFVFLSSPAQAQAQNKVGVNIGDHWDELQEAAGMVGPGGWIVVMACPSDGDILNESINKYPNINFVIRGHYPSMNPNPDQARAWAATLGSLSTSKKLYFMPWNEPNQKGFADYGTPPEVVEYIDTLTEAIAPIRGSKVFLLSPMLNQTYAANCHDPNSNSQFLNYVSQLGGGAFFDQFDGIAMNLYDFEPNSQPLQCTNPNANAGRFNEVLAQMGVSDKPVFAVESGVARHGVEYKDALLENFYRQAFPTWHAHGNFVMSAIFSYDPEHEENWDIFSSNTGKFFDDYVKEHDKNGCCVQPGSGNLTVPGYNLCPGRKYSFYKTNPETECAVCGHGKSYVQPLENGLVCEDHFIEEGHSTERKLSISPTPVRTARQEKSGASGKLYLEEVNIPALEEMEATYTQAVMNLFPAWAHRKGIEAQDKKIPVNLDHNVVGTRPDGSISEPEDIPQSEFFLSNVGKSTGLSKLISVITGKNEPIKDNRFVVSLEVPEAEEVSYQAACPVGPEVLAKSGEDLDVIEDEYSTTSIFSVVTDIFERAGEFFEQTTKKTVLAVRSRGVAATKTVNETVNFGSRFVPSKMTEIYTQPNQSISVPVKYNKESTSGPPRMNFELRSAWFTNCAMIGYSTPNRIAIETIDPSCKSRNLQDYTQM